jgi:Spy/CpxP family protein refolding chaperone
MKNSYKFWIVISFILVFIAGILGGVLLERNLLNTDKLRERDRSGRVHFPTMEEMAETLQLSDAQQEAIHEVFKQNEIRLKELRSEIHKQFSSLRGRLLEDIKHVLNDEQKKQFNAMIETYRTLRHEEWERREKDKRENPPRKENTNEK